MQLWVSAAAKARERVSARYGINNDNYLALVITLWTSIQTLIAG